MGFGIAVLLGVLVFWAWPTYRKAKSPLGEVISPPLIVKFLKESPVAEGVQDLARGLAEEWERVVSLLAVPRDCLPREIYVYVCEDKRELPLLFNARQAEETTPYALVDLIADEPAAGALARLACSLAYGGPGNPVFPRGLVLWLDDPEAEWATEAVAYGTADAWEFLFRNAQRLLPEDPWERFFFNVDAPWVTSLPNLESVRWLLTASSVQSRQAPGWEALAAGLAEFVVTRYGGDGVRAFWLASGWEKGATALSLSPGEFAAEWELFLDRARLLASSDPLIAVKGALFSGSPTRALDLLGGVEGREADLLRAQAFLALGRPGEALSLLPAATGLEGLTSAPAIGSGQLILIAEAGNWRGALDRAEAAWERAISFWGLSEDRLPERIVIYVIEAGPPVDLPWGVIWTSPENADLSRLVVRFALEAGSSTLGLPRFDTFTEGLTLLLAHPERDFRGEAAAVVGEGRWVSLGQSLFDSYPEELAEAEAGALAQFLVEEYGREAVLSLWGALLQGLSPYSAVEQVLGISLDELDQAIRVWAKG